MRYPESLDKGCIARESSFIAGSQGSAFSQIFLNLELVPKMQMEKLLTERYTLESWQCLFGAIRATLGLDTLESDEYPEEASC